MHSRGLILRKVPPEARQASSQAVRTVGMEVPAPISMTDAGAGVKGRPVADSFSLLAGTARVPPPVREHEDIGTGHSPHPGQEEVKGPQGFLVDFHLEVKRHGGFRRRLRGIENAGSHGTRRFPYRRIRPPKVPVTLEV